MLTVSCYPESFLIVSTFRQRLPMPSSGNVRKKGSQFTKRKKRLGGRRSNKSKLYKMCTKKKRWKQWRVVMDKTRVREREKAKGKKVKIEERTLECTKAVRAPSTKQDFTKLSLPSSKPLSLWHSCRNIETIKVRLWIKRNCLHVYMLA